MVIGASGARGMTVQRVAAAVISQESENVTILSLLMADKLAGIIQMIHVLVTPESAQVRLA